MNDTEETTCPECKGEGMVRYCAMLVCRICRGEGKITAKRFSEYEQMKNVTMADLMRPSRTPVTGQLQQD